MDYDVMSVMDGSDCSQLQHGTLARSFKSRKTILRVDRFFFFLQLTQAFKAVKYKAIRTAILSTFT